MVCLIKPSTVDDTKIMTEKIVFLDSDSLPPHIPVPRPAFDHEWVQYPATPPEQVKERLSDATLAIVNKARVTADVLDACPDLRMISVAATGTDIVDVAACRERGIVVSNVQGYAVDTVPEHAFTLILALRRALLGFAKDVADGAWSRANQFCLFTHGISDLKGSRLGIIGNGELGRATAAIGANGFGMEVVYMEHATVTDAQRAAMNFVSFDEILETADVISVHCPLTPKTENLFDMSAFKRMKKTAILINTARGAIVSEPDLVMAIETGEIGGAGIDVLAKEPPAAGHPYEALLGRPNFILTPHIAWASDQAMSTVAATTIRNIENFVAGNPTNVVS